MTPALLFLAASIDISGTTVILRDTAQPGAVAEGEMRNIATNSDHDEGAYGLTHGDLEVWLTFRWNSGLAGADSIHVEPPPGLICEPASCVLELLEGNSGVMFLYP